MKNSTGRLFKILLIPLIFSFHHCAVYHSFKALPEGVDYRGGLHPADTASVHFYRDFSAALPDGELIRDQEIFDRVFHLIDHAEEYILIDMFLFNGDRGSMGSVYRELSAEMTEHLIQRKTEIPALAVDIITDPINTVYGGIQSPHLNRMRDAGIRVIETDLTALRDSNPLYSIIWRTLFKWTGNSGDGGIFPNPFAESPLVPLRSYLDLFNFKANHRKTFIADHKGEMISIVMSANAHDASSAHSNVAVEIHGPFWRDLWSSEQAVALFSGSELRHPVQSEKNIPEISGPEAQVQLITEKQIYESILTASKNAGDGDSLSVGVFYLSSTDIIDALCDASCRGAAVRVILDPNKDAFGRKKNGVPNRQSARRLYRRSKGKINVRWYDTRGEQFHTKMMLVKYADGHAELILGSSNYTRRNLKNYNLETNIRLTGPADFTPIRDADTYFRMIWSNRDGRICTADYGRYQDGNPVRILLARWMEYSGMSTF